MQQRIRQRSAISLGFRCSRAGVHHHSRRIIDHSQVIVLENSYERNFLGNRAQWSKLRGPQNGNTFGSIKGTGNLGGRVIYEDFFLRNQLLNASAAGFLNMGGEKLIQAFAIAFEWDGNQEIGNCSGIIQNQ